MADSLEFVTTRIESSLKDKLEAAAFGGGRSLSSELRRIIVTRFTVRPTGKLKTIMIIRLVSDDIAPYTCTPPLRWCETTEVSRSVGRALIKSGKATRGKLERLESCCFGRHNDLVRVRYS